MHKSTLQASQTRKPAENLLCIAPFNWFNPKMEKRCFYTQTGLNHKGVPLTYTFLIWASVSYTINELLCQLH